jgi:PAS domain S-box-containing protein
MAGHAEPAEQVRPATGPKLDRAELATFLSLMPDAAIAVDGDGKVVALNELAQVMFGYPAGALEGKPIEVLVPARARESHRRQRAVFSASPTSRTMGSGLDLRGRKSDGTEVPVDISLAPLQTDEGLLVVAAVRDMTERKATEERLRLQASWQAASAQIRLELLSEAPLERSLGLVCRWASELAGAAAAAVVSVQGSGIGVLATAGDKEALDALAERLEDRPSLVSGTDEAELGHGLMARSLPIACPKGAEVSQAALVVIGVDDGGDPGRNEVLESLAGQAVLAFELATVRAERDRMAIAAERERIARDLHDLIIQRLFGAGLRLQGALALISNPTASTRVSSTISELDATIREIREAIFSLEAAPGTGLEARVRQVVARAGEALGFEPVLSFRRMTRQDVPLEAELEAATVLREALSNVARHARAGKVEVHVEVGSELAVRVVDDGVGIGEPKRLSGIANARARAALLGGRLDLSRASGGGTCFDWRVPLRQPEKEQTHDVG